MVVTLCMFVLEWLHYIIAWCVSHMFQVMANGETFGRSLILSPHQTTPVTLKPARATPNRSQSTPKTSLYRRLSARLSGRRTSQGKSNDDISSEQCDNMERRLQLARNTIKMNSENDNVADSYVGQSFCDDLRTNNDTNEYVDHVDICKDKSGNKENKDCNKLGHDSIKINVRDKREVFRNKSMNVFNLVDCLAEVGSVHSSLTKSLSDLDYKDGGFLMPASKASKELQQSTTTISSGKKRSRNSTDSNFQVSTVDGTVSPDKGEDSHWKTIKRLKIKDSFKFKNRPTIFKKSKKESVTKNVGDISVEPVSPDSVKPTDPCGEYVASTSSPIREDDNTSICSMNTSKQSGFFDISLASIRSSKTIKSASKLRRSVKSFTASFRTERKKKYEKRNTIQVDPSCLDKLSDLKNVSTPKRNIDAMNFDISPVQVDTVDTTGVNVSLRGADELDDSVIFKTPQSMWTRVHRRSICDGGDVTRSTPLPSSSPAPSRREQPQPATPLSTQDARAISQCHGISLPVLTSI